MSEDLLRNETHATGVIGTLHMQRKAPVNGEDIDNVTAGDIYYDDAKEIIYIYDGSAWYGASATAS